MEQQNNTHPSITNDTEQKYESTLETWNYKSFSILKSSLFDSFYQFAESEKS